MPFLDVPEDQHYLFDFLIDSLNENGFLEQDLEELASEISFRKVPGSKFPNWKERLGISASWNLLAPDAVMYRSICCCS
jgi:hypothetical protein